MARGGKAITGAAVGLLMLDTRFPRIPGDVGNMTTFPFPLHARVVRDATPSRVVRNRAEGLLPAFVEAGRTLVADGVDGVVANCGFLALYQRELAEGIGVPVLSSSLMQVAMVNALLAPGRRVGVLTVSARALGADTLRAAGVPESTPIGSTEGGREFSRVMLNDEPEMDVQAARDDNIAAACALQAAHPDLGALVLECTNMAPYGADIASATGLPVFSMVNLITWFQGGLVPRRFG
ncbi:aspartate/glutamate racemase family protein [Oceaniglobus trochenteri]|uniref:aspartate/glutamate racemase family protein n=1 Tax=Oceaniglobus trochenteri TaxID=2763260 RepID=UPI001CFF91D1|nr:aspartate/glutamate racemase family protein [Oceaniglobus trochenteri]